MIIPTTRPQININKSLNKLLSLVFSNVPLRFTFMKFNLNCNKIKSLGWYPRKDLKNMFLSLISFWEECDKNM